MTSGRNHIPKEDLTFDNYTNHSLSFLILDSPSGWTQHNSALVLLIFVRLTAINLK